MGRIDIVIQDDTEQKLRQEVFKSMGMKKGNMKYCCRRSN